MSLISKYKEHCQKLEKKFLDISKDVLITWLIMPTICAIVSAILTKYYGVNFGDDLPNFIKIMMAPPLWLILVKFISVGLSEEAMFRFFLQDKVFGKLFCLPKAVGWGLASAMFGAAHLMNPGGMPLTIPQAVGAAFAGLWFGHLYEKKGLLHASLVHGLYDASVIWLWFHT